MFVYPFRKLHIFTCLDTIMPDRFRVRFELPAVGSLPVALTANGDSVSFIASHTPYDSLSNLVAALITIVLTDTVDISIRWNTEPVEYEFRFETDANDIILSVIRWPDSTRLRESSQSAFTARGSRMDIVLPFWRALRRLESQATTRWEWQHPFPDRDMQKFNAHPWWRAGIDDPVQTAR